MTSRRAPLALVFVILIVDEIIASLLLPVFPEFTKGLSRPELWFGIAMFAFAFMQFLAAPALGALSDRHGRKPIFGVAAIGTLLSMVLLLPVRYVLFLGNRALDGSTKGLNAVVKSTIVDLSPEADVQRNVGLSGSISYAGFLLGPAVASGVLWFADSQQWESVRSLVVAGLVFAAVNVVLSFLVPETRRRDRMEPPVESPVKSAVESPVDKVGENLGRRIWNEMSPLTMLARFQ
jgi:MFS transporter, DHA1 family, tetracycline resistance protein